MKFKRIFEDVRTMTFSEVKSVVEVSSHNLHMGGLLIHFSDIICHYLWMAQIIIIMILVLYFLLLLMGHLLFKTNKFSCYLYFLNLNTCESHLASVSHALKHAFEYRHSPLTGCSFKDHLQVFTSSKLWHRLMAGGFL